METGKTSKYIKYAIGEIILVMIGILLALQVNNWNQERQLKKEELTILKSLHQEFNENLIIFDNIYNKHLFRKKSIEIIMSDNVNQLSNDSLDFFLNGATDQWTFDPFQGIYHSVINSGKIDLILKDSLKLRIAKFQDILIDYKEEEILTNNFCANNVYPFIIDNLKMNFNTAFGISQPTKEEMIAYRKDIENLIESEKFENLLLYVYGYFSPVFIEGPILREEMTSIIGLLESEIESL